MTERSVVVRLRAATTEFTAAMGRAGTSVKQLRDELDKAAKTDKGRAALNDLAATATGAGLALVAGFGAGVAAAARFEKQMSEVAAVADASAEDLTRLSEAALRAGEDTSFSATEAAKAEAELAKAGINTADILGGALAGALDLAAAGSLDLTEAAETAARAMNVFKLGGADVGHIADVLAAGANKSAADVHQLGEALRMGGLASASAGLSLEDTVGVLAAFHDRALIGSDAGTSLKTMLTFLASPTEKATSLMKKLGIEVYDTAGNFVGVERLAGILQERLGLLTQQERQAALATIFGSDAMRAALVMYELGEKGVQEYIAAVDDQGAATDVARLKTDNLVGDFERLTGSLETLAISSAGGATSGLRKLVQVAGELVDSIGDMPPVLSNSVFLVGGLLGSTLLLVGGMLRARTAVAGMLDSLAQIGPGSERAARGLGAVTRWAGRAIAVFAVLEVASAVLSVAQKDLQIQVDALATGLRDFGEGGELAGEAARVLGEDFKDLKVGLAFLADTDNSRRRAVKNLQTALESVVPGLDGTSTSLAKTRERVEAMDQALASLVQGGRPAEAQAAFDRLAASVAADGVSVQELQALFPAFAGALEVAAKGGNEVADAQGAAATTAKTLASTWASAVEEGRTLVDVFDDLNGAAINWAQAQINVEAALDDAIATFKENSGELAKNKNKLDLNTEAGRANMQAILDYAEAARDATQARFDETGSVDEAAKMHATYRQRLIDALVPLVGTKKAAAELADQYLRMPAQVTTKIVTNVGYNFPVPSAAARQAAMDLQRELNHYRLSIPVSARVSGGGNAKVNRWGGVDYAMAGGGLLGAFVTDSPTVLMGERATKREAYIPENGDHARNMRTLATAAAWEGQQVVPAGASPGALARELKAALAGAGGTPVVNVYIGGQRLDERIDYRVEAAMDEVARTVGSGVRG